MRFLLIDTCGVTGTVALADTALDSPMIAIATLSGRSASERLVATIRDLTATHHLPLQSLNSVAVVSGPGSFTGVRVGLSAAKGLCEALNLPLIAISRLALLACNAAPPADRTVFALLDAGRGEFYLGIYANGVPAKEALVTGTELLDVIAATTESSGSPPIVITCDATVAEALADAHPLLSPEPTAEDALPLVLRRLEARNFEDVAAIDANYLRRTDAEIFARRAALPTSSPSTHSPVP